MRFRDLCGKMIQRCVYGPVVLPPLDHKPIASPWISVDDHLSRFRHNGWTIAVHNDYKLEGTDYTFYLLTHPSGVWAKGEGTTDGAALTAAAEDTKRRRVFSQLYDAASQKAEVIKLRMLLARAINQMNGAISFSGPCTGELLRKIAIEEKLYIFDEIHHAAACPANHYHKSRLPTGKCSCGAEKGDVF